MAHQIIRQPDGNFAVFSSIVDGWVLMEATAGEIADYFAEKAAAAAREDAEKALAAVMEGEPRRLYSRFAMTFDEANAASRSHDGPWLDGGAWVEP